MDPWNGQMSFKYQAFQGGAIKCVVEQIKSWVVVGENANLLRLETHREREMYFQVPTVYPHPEVSKASSTYHTHDGPID